MPQPYSASLNTGHVDTGTEIIHAPDVNAMATHVNQLEVDANTGGPLDLPGHKNPSTTDHDGRYIVLGTTHTRSKTIIIPSPSGTFPLTPFPLWRVPYAITVVSIYAYRVGGTSASINARAVTNTTARTLLAGDFSVPVGPPWANAGTLAGSGAANLVAGDSLEALLQTAVGSPTLVGIQINYTEPVN
jgi:hypothetical protein